MLPAVHAHRIEQLDQEVRWQQAPDNDRPGESLSQKQLLALVNGLLALQPRQTPPLPHSFGR